MSKFVMVPREEIEAACARFAKAQIFDFSRRMRSLLEQPAEQHRGKPVDALLLDDCVEHKHPGYGAGYFGTEVIQLYTHADAGEVEQLREEAGGLEQVLKLQVDALKALIFAARTTGGTAGPDDGLIQACEKAEQAISLGGIGKAYMRGADAALSTSEEPSATVERDERASPSDFDIFRADLADHCAALERKPLSGFGQLSSVLKRFPWC